MSLITIPGLYKTKGGKVYHFDGTSWNPFNKNFKEFDTEYETWEQPEEEMIKLDSGSAKLSAIKEWWSKTSRIEGVDWNAMIELGEILMKED